MIRFTFFLFMTMGFANANAQVLLEVKRSRTTDGQDQLCVSEFGTFAAGECFAIQPIVPQALECRSSLGTFTEIRVTELATKEGRSGTEFLVAVEWAALSGGALKFAGPQGKTYAIGEIRGTNVLIDRFVDGAFSQQLDRSTVFAETDRPILDQATLLWLNEVLGPYLERYFRVAASLP